MYPAQFEYVAPATLDEAIKLLAESGGDAKILAGGHSLLPAMKLRLAQPAKLIDLRKIPGLNEIKVDGSGTTIGAMVTHVNVARSAEVQRALPALAGASSVAAWPTPTRPATRRRRSWSWTVRSSPRARTASAPSPAPTSSSTS